MSNLQVIQSGLEGLAKVAAKAFRGFADITEARGKNGITTEVTREQQKTVSDRSTVTKTVRTDVETVDHAKRADYFRGVVATQIEKAFQDFGKSGQIRIGNQIVNLQEIKDAVNLIVAGFVLPDTTNNAENNSPGQEVNLQELFTLLNGATASREEETPSISATDNGTPDVASSNSSTNSPVPEAASKPKNRRSPKP